MNHFAYWCALTASVFIWSGFSSCPAAGETTETYTGRTGAPLPAWSRGVLDIHQISTGRGSSTLVIAPDGTSIMIDAGAASGDKDVTLATRPNESRRPGEWIGRYALRRLKDANRERLDYFVATHIHPDHIGNIDADSPASAHDPKYKLSGITDVAEIVPINVIIDRGFPDYAYPFKWSADFAVNYFDYISSHRRTGGRCERVKVGSRRQIRLVHAADDFPSFAVRNIAANGEIWTGAGEDARSGVPSSDQLAGDDLPDENMCSIALKISHGKFDYFAGADIHCDTRDATQPWRDIETPAARVCGEVEVALANHHAYFDAVGPEAVRALRPQAWVVPAWHISHLNIAQLGRMLSERLYKGHRDVFTTDIMPSVELINRRFINKVKSTSGHIVVRVLPGGDTFFVLITDNSNEADTIKAIHGPYTCK
jgi:hypothetical protein